MSKIFWVLNLQTGAVDYTIESDTPRSAALKAANKKLTRICLVEADAGKVHLFEGMQVPLQAHEVTSYTEQRNITTKAVVRKLGYKKVASNFLMADMDDLCTVVRDEFSF
jgi:hypothetical protein